jgi:c-di-GMP phosphodiesterase
LNITGSIKNYHIGRQGIYDRRQEKFAYELLFRSCETDHAIILDDDLATTQVILNAFAEIGLDQIVGGHKAFINLTQKFIQGLIPIPFETSRVVLEIPETLELTLQNIAGIRRLRGEGYSLALDDVDSYAFMPLIELVDYVKIDLVTTPRARLGELVQAFKCYPVKMLAEKVETQQELNLCLHLGFEYFQGFFLCKPSVSKVRTILPNRMVILQLLGELVNPELDFNRLERVLSRDTSMGYRLLQLVSSAQFGMLQEVKSLRQAITLVGIEQLRKWLVLFLMHDTDEKKRELVSIAMMRAWMCQLLAQRAGMRGGEEYFLVGLFSLLDALYDMPMHAIVEQLPLAADVRTALLDHTGDKGQALACVLAFERADWGAVEYHHLTAASIRAMFYAAVKETETFVTNLGGL